MKGKSPDTSSGKTRFNRGKPSGTAWTTLREQALKDGSWSRPAPRHHKPRQEVAQ